MDDIQVSLRAGGANFGQTGTVKIVTPFEVDVKCKSMMALPVLWARVLWLVYEGSGMGG